MRPSAIRFATGALFLSHAGATAAVAQGVAAPRVMAIVSQDADPYQQALAGFRRELERANPGVTFDLILLHGDAGKLPEALGAVTRTRPALVLVLGTLATREAVKQIRDIPIVAGMILNAGELDRAANATGVYLEYPVQTELEWLRRLLPAERRVGVIYNSAENERRIGEAQRVAAAGDLSIQAIRVSGPEELPDALMSLGNRADVLWGVADPVVYNPETARSLLLFSLRNRIPLIGQSTAWVKAGALYALDRDYADVGAQCAELAAKVLGGQSPSALPPAPPRKVRYAINRRTAAEMKLHLPERVLGAAAEVVN